MATYLDELVQKITTKADLKGFDDLDRKQKRAIKSNDLLAKSFRRAFGIFFGIQGIRSVIKTTREIDLLQRSIQGLTGSTQDWEYLRREAYRTGTDLTKAAQAYKNFYSAANMAGFNRNAIQGMFSDVLVAGRGIGANQQQIGAALLALEQMLSKGKVSMEELRRQMGNALPGSFEIAAKSMGVTTQEFNKLLEAGLSSAEFVPKFTKMLKQELGKGFEANIKSLDFALVNLNTAWMEFQANILQGEAGEALAQLVRDVTQILRSQELLNFIKLIGKALGFVIKNIKTITLLWGFGKFMKLISFFRATHGAIVGVSKVVRILSLDIGTLSRYISFLNSTGGLASMASNIGAAAKATYLLYGQWMAILGVIFMIQDVITWLVDRDKTTKTWTGYMLGKSKEGVGVGNLLTNPINYLTPAERKKLQIWNKAHPDQAISTTSDGFVIPWVDPLTGRDQRPRIPDANTTGYAVPIPDKGYVGTLPNLNSNYSSSDSKSLDNNITINIYAGNSQPETIAVSVEDALQKFFNKYNLGYGY